MSCKAWFQLALALIVLVLTAMLAMCIPETAYRQYESPQPIEMRD